MNRMSSWLVLLLLVGFCWSNGEAIQPVARLSLHSKAIGVYMRADNGKTFRAFKGIPYAKPPTGDRRFKPPEKSEGWQGLLNVSHYPPPCLQKDFSKKTFATLGKEDCLYLNIYTPLLSRKRRSFYPIIVYFGGQTFSSANIELNDPRRILSQNIILITVNYRLGPFGFLSTADNSSHGNYGLLDQVMALQWIKDNIGAFGGDSSKITLAGQGAGATSILLHMLSPLTKDLFHSAIIQSGSPFCLQWPSDNGLSLTLQLAKDVDCASNSTQEIVSCLQTIDGTNLVSATEGFHLPWGPVIDKFHYITNDPQVSIENGHIHSIPVILGVSQKYNGYNFNPHFASTGIASQLENLSDGEMARNMVEYLLFSSFIFKDEVQAETLLEAVMEEYFDVVNVSNPEEIKQTLQMINSDIVLNPCMVKTAKILKKFVPVRFYSFEYLSKQYQRKANNLSSGLDAELFYLFHLKNVSEELGENDREISNILLSFWSNFAIYRNPTPSVTEAGINWDMMTENNNPYLKIDKPLSMEKDFRQAKFSFWEETVPQLLEGEFKKIHFLE